MKNLEKYTATAEAIKRFDFERNLIGEKETEVGCWYKPTFWEWLNNWEILDENKTIRDTCPEGWCYQEDITEEEADKRTLYVITAIGVSNDTEVHFAYSHDEASSVAVELLKEFGIKEFQEMCYDCWKGFSNRCGADVEVEIHEKMLKYPIDIPCHK